MVGFDHPSSAVKHHNNNLPYLSEMENCLELKNRLKKTGANTHSNIETIIDDVSEVANRLNNIPIDSIDSIRSSSLGNSTNRLNCSSSLNKLNSK